MEYEDDDKEENHVFIPTAWTTGIEVFPLPVYNEIVFNLISDASVSCNHISALFSNPNYSPSARMSKSKVKQSLYTPWRRLGGGRRYI
jgi:hypothetical protein